MSMKRVISAAFAICVLGGCAEDGPLDEAAEQVVEDAMPMLSADGNPPPGRYKAISEDDGTLIYEELRPDGTYVLSNAGGVPLEEGRWTQRSPEALCLRADRETADEICYVEQVGEDGVWRSTHPQTGAVSRIERISE